VSILERTFEMLESTLSDVGQRVGVEFDASGEPRRIDGKEQPFLIGGAGYSEGERVSAL
jgi:hypothetical protein